MNRRLGPVGFPDLLNFRGWHHDPVVRGAVEVGDCVDRSVMFALGLVKGHSGPGASGKLDGPAELQRPKPAAVNQNPVSQLQQEEKSNILLYCIESS